MQSLRTTDRMVTVVVVLICSLSFAVAQPISLVQKPLWPGFRRGAAGGLAISNQYAFVGASQGGLMVFDVGTPSLPRLVTQLRDIGWAHRVKLAGHYAYV